MMSTKNAKETKKLTNELNSIVMATKEDEAYINIADVLYVGLSGLRSTAEKSLDDIENAKRNDIQKEFKKIFESIGPVMNEVLNLKEKV